MNLLELHKEINTNCREVDGITVGLLDGIIAQIRILRHRKLSHEEVQEAFLDMADDEDVQWLCDKLKHKSESTK